MDNMPPLPEPDVRSLTVYFTDDGHRHSRAFTADQMHAYARAYAEQRCAPLVEALRTALCQLELIGGKRRRFPNEGQDEIHAAVLEQIDEALATQEQSK